MSQIDKQLKLIEDFNNRNFKVDEDFIGMFKDIYEQIDNEILTAPF
jgi:hypothetical protein